MMHGVLIGIGFVFGTIIGSFLGVVVWRMGTGQGFGGRSMCLSCNRTLAWYELVPVVSFLMQRGKCRTCKTSIPAGDFWIEIATGLAFTGIAWHFGSAALVMPSYVVEMVATAAATCVAIVIAAYDIRHKLIHLPSLIALFLLGTLAIAAHGMVAGEPVSITHVGARIVSAGIVAAPFFLLWLVSRGAWIGFGDIELMLLAGGWFGIVGGYSAVVLGFWIACAVVVPTSLYCRIVGRRMDREIPMGPFLLAGMYAVGILGLNIFAFVMGMVH